MPAFRLSRSSAALAAVATAAALAVLFVIPFPEGTGFGRKLFFAIILGGFAAFGAWSLAGVPALVGDTIGWMRQRGTKRGAPAPHHSGPMPQLSARRQSEVRRIVRVMADHGLFAPEVPDAALLFAGIAELDESVKPDTILSALTEVDYYHPGCDPERFLTNILLHDSHAEQDEAAQIADLVRQAGGALSVIEVAVRYSDLAGQARAQQVDVSMIVNGAALALSYAGSPKYLSTHIHHALATRLRDGGGGKRLAWLWTDQGAWISCLDDGAVEALNAALKLGPRTRCAWSWVDEDEPMAAGQMVIRKAQI